MRPCSIQHRRLHLESTEPHILLSADPTTAWLNMLADLLPLIADEGPEDSGRDVEADEGAAIEEGAMAQPLSAQESITR